MFFFDFNPYIAIIGDIMQSKQIVDRECVQKKMVQTLAKINKKYTDDIAAKFTITLGDEFQGLLSCGTNVLKIITEIENELDDVDIRFGIGVGDITTPINREIAIGADGPGYYQARRAIDYLKKSEKKKESGKANIRLAIDGKEQETTELVNVIFSLMTAMKSSWTARQREVVWKMLQNSTSQVEVASELGIRQSSVQKSLANANFYTYKEAYLTVGKVLGEIRREHV